MAAGGAEGLRDYGRLLEERFWEVMAARATSLDEVMTGEDDLREWSLAVAWLAHAATRVVATRRAEAVQADAGAKVDERQAFYEFLADMDAELDDYERWRNGGGANESGGQSAEEMDDAIGSKSDAFALRWSMNSQGVGAFPRQLGGRNGNTQCQKHAF